MNDVLYELVIFSVLCGIFLYRSVEILTDLVKQHINSKKFPGLEDMPEKERCLVHRWDNITLAVKGLETKPYNVCTQCALVSGTRKKLNKPAMEVYRNSIRRRDENIATNKKVMKIRQVKLDEAMNRLIKSFIQADSTIPMSQNIDFLQQFFRKAVIEIDQVNYATLETYNEFKH